jgi:transposase
MQAGRPAPDLSLTPAERETLERWSSGRDRRLARRAAIVLGLEAGDEPKTLARRFRLSEPTVGKWRTRFEASRLDGLADAARSGAPRRILADDVERVLNRLQTPPAGASRWTTRSLARACGVSQTTVSRIWRAHGIDPRSGTLRARAGSSGNGGLGPPPTPAAALVPPSGDGRPAELARLARELSEMRALAPPEEAPFLRVALEAIEAALLSATSPRISAARESSRLVRMRTQAAVAQARALVEEARRRIAELQQMHETLFRRGDGGRSGRG